MSVPYTTRLVCQEAADEEEQGHAEEEEELQGGRPAYLHAKRLQGHMVHHDENHREPPQGIEPAKTRCLACGTLLCRFAIRRIRVVRHVA